MGKDGSNYFPFFYRISIYVFECNNAISSCIYRDGNTGKALRQIFSLFIIKRKWSTGYRICDKK